MSSPATPPLPRPVALCAPWTWCAHIPAWRRWTLLIALLTAGYVLAPVPIGYTLRRLHWDHPAVVECVEKVYFPLVWAYENSEVVQGFYGALHETLDAWLGAP